MCAYLETWHLDIEEFIDLRKNTGDDRRTHDMNTANWIPDLFMKRVVEKNNGLCFLLMKYQSFMKFQELNLKKNMKNMNL